MSRIGVYVATVIAGLACAGSALAQGVPPRLQGDYAIGSCAAPDVDVTIDAAGLHVFDPQSGDVIADVAALSVEDRGAQVVMDVVVGGDEDGTMILVALGDGTIEVRYEADGGEPEAPQRLELCVAADVPAQPPAATTSMMPDALLGEWVTGSCAAPQDRLMIESRVLTAYDQGSPNPTAIVDVISLTEIPGGYLVDADFAGQRVGVEFILVNQDVMELVFIGPDGGRDTPQELLRCSPVVETTPPATQATLPDAYLGRYAVGADAVCGVGETEVIFAPNGLTVFDGGEEVLTIDVVAVLATEPDLVFAVVARGDPGDVTMRQIGAASYEVVFTEPDGSSEAPEIFNRCDAVVEAEPMPPATAVIPDAYLGRYVFDGNTCDDVANDEYVLFEPTRLVVMDGGQETFVISVIGVTSTAPSLVFTVDVPGEGRGEISMTPSSDNRYDVLMTEEGSTSSDREEFIYCDAGPAVDGPAVDGPVVDGPVAEPVATEVPEAYLGRYAMGDDPARCSAEDESLIFEPTRLVMMDNGEEAMVITVTGVIAVEPNLVLAIVEDRMGEAELALAPRGNGVYDATITEPDGSEEHETLVLCAAASEGVVTDGPVVDGPVMDGPVVGGEGDLTAFLFDSSAAAFGAFMTELEAVCTPGSEQLCLDTFYVFADVTGDGLLTQAELARLTRFGAKWAIAANMPGLEAGQKLAIHLATMVTGPLIADGLIYNFDYDGDDALSRVELFPEGAENAPLAVEALMRTFTEDTIDDVIDALEELDSLM